MHNTTNPRAVAAETCRLLEERFPSLEIRHEEPESFFDGFFTDIGFPGPDVYPVWAEGGHVIYLEAPRIHWWQERSFTFSASESDRGGMAVIFVHADGYVSVVDESDGNLAQLFPTPHPVILAEFLKLFFEEGRRDLQDRAGNAPAIEGVYMPFLQYPDDFTENFSAMPLAPVAPLRKILLDRAASDQAWLSEMEDPEPRIRAIRRQKEAETPETFLQIPGFESPDSDERSPLGQVLEHLLREQDRKRNQRMELFRVAETILSEAFLRDRSPLHLREWGVGCHALGGTYAYPPLDYPIAVSFNDQVFAPLLDRQFDPAMCDTVFRVALTHLRGEAEAAFPVALDLPSYAEQVENGFLQQVLIHQAPLLARKAAETSAFSKASAGASLQRRRAVCERIRAAADET